MTFNIYIGWDSREPVAAYVAAHSILRRTQANVKIHYLRHRDLRKRHLFDRPWRVRGNDGEYIDERDGKPFSTEFSHTRFLVPVIQWYSGWALFIDCDMIFTGDISNLIRMQNEKYAVMCVKHKQYGIENSNKMDNRLQQSYYRKNWSSFMMLNCSHPANRAVTKTYVCNEDGLKMHAFGWLSDEYIGSLPYSYNFISGVSPPLVHENPKKPRMPDAIHYTEGGPWVESVNADDVKYGHLWELEYEDWQRNGEPVPTSIPTTKYEEARKVK